jgi:hypothetical protein
LHVKWRASKEAVEYWLRWSTDGENWRALASGLTGNEASLEASQLPSGKVFLQLVAHDGFYSSTSRPVEISLPDRAPEVAILHPVDGRTYAANQVLRLWGSVSGQEGEPVAPERAVWSLDGSELARGLDAWTSLEPGEHKLTLLIEGEGGSAEASVVVTVVDLEQSAGPVDAEQTSR